MATPPSHLAPPAEDETQVVYEEEEDFNVDVEEDNNDADSDALVRFTDHTGPVYAVAFSQKTLPNGAIAFASGAGDDTVIIYHITGDTEPHKIILKAHQESINFIKFSPDGLYLATGDLQGVVITWDVQTGAQVAVMKTTHADDPVKVRKEKEDNNEEENEEECEEEEKQTQNKNEEEEDEEDEGEEEEDDEGRGVEWISWHPTLPAILVGDSAGFIWLFNARNGNCAKVYSCHAGAVTCGGFRNDASYIWSASADAVVKIWAPKSGQAISTINGIDAHQAPITAGCSSPNGALIATGDVEGNLKIIRFEDGKVLGSIIVGDTSIEAVSFSPDNSLIAVATLNCNLSLWNSNTKVMRHALPHPDGVTCVQWHPNNNFVITGCIDGNIRIWDSRNGQLVYICHGHNDSIYQIDVRRLDPTKSDILILSGSEDNTVILNTFVEEVDGIQQNE